MCVTFHLISCDLEFHGLTDQELQPVGSAAIRELVEQLSEQERLYKLELNLQLRQMTSQLDAASILVS